jgi:hypothetical protein
MAVVVATIPILLVYPFLQRYHQGRADGRNQGLIRQNFVAAAYVQLAGRTSGLSMLHAGRWIGHHG